MSFVAEGKQLGVTGFSFDCLPYADEMRAAAPQRPRRDFRRSLERVALLAVVEHARYGDLRLTPHELRHRARRAARQ